MLFPLLYGEEKFFNSGAGCRQPLLLGSAPSGCPLRQKRVLLMGHGLGRGLEGEAPGTARVVVPRVLE